MLRTSGVYILIMWYLIKEKAATLQILSSTVQELTNQISTTESVQQFVHHLSCSLIGCNRPARPTRAANSIKQHSESSLLSPTHLKTMKHSSSMGVADGDHMTCYMIYNLLLRPNSNQS